MSGFLFSSVPRCFSPCFSRRKRGLKHRATLATLGFIAVIGADASELPPHAETFTEKYCAKCHNDIDKEGRLDLTSLKFTPGDPANFQQWIKVHDRLQAHEMPPKEKKQPE